MRRGRRKALYRRERDSLEGLHEKAEIQPKALRRGKYLAFSEDTCLEKERVPLKVTPGKDKSWFERSCQSFSQLVWHTYLMKLVYAKCIIFHTHWTEMQSIEHFPELLYRLVSEFQHSATTAW